MRSNFNFEIGNRKNGKTLRYALDERNTNTMTLVTGITGSGKTNFLFHAIRQSVQQGNIVLVPDYCGSIDLKKIPSHYIVACNARDFPVSPFSKMSPKEHDSTTARRCADFLGAALNLGENQKSLMREIVQERLENDYPITLPGLALTAKMKSIVAKGQEYDSLLPKLQKYAALHIFEKSEQTWGDLYQDKAKVYVIHFDENFTRTESIFVTEMILMSLFEWLRARGQEKCDRRIQIHLDEAQDLSMSEKSPVSLFMRQGRKFGCSVFLYTQSLFTFKPEVREIFTQAALTINFGQTPQGARQLAGMLKIEDNDKKKLAEMIMNLDKGQAVARGRFIGQNGKMTNLIPIQVQVPLVKDFIDMEYFHGPFLLVDKTAGNIKTDAPSISAKEK